MLDLIKLQPNSPIITSPHHPPAHPSRPTIPNPTHSTPHNKIQQPNLPIYLNQLQQYTSNNPMSQLNKSAHYTSQIRSAQSTPINSTNSYYYTEYPLDGSQKLKNVQYAQRKNTLNDSMRGNGQLGPSINNSMIVIRPEPPQSQLPRSPIQTPPTPIPADLSKSLQSLTHAMISQMSKSISEITKAQIQLLRSHSDSISTENSKINSRKYSRSKYEEQNQHYQNYNNGGMQSKTVSKHASLMNPSNQYVQEDQERFQGEKNFLNQLAKYQRQDRRSSLKSFLSTNIHDGSYHQYENDKQFRENMKQLLKQMKLINQNKKQPRGVWLDIDIGQPPKGKKDDLQKNNRQLLHYLKQKVFKIISDVLSVSFNLLYKQGMDFQKVKAYCSQNFLINFCKLVTATKMKPKQMKILEQLLQQDILPYLNLSYPRSEQKLMNKELKSKINQKDIFNQNRFDLVYNSQVQISTKQISTNGEIMRIMNYIINLPDKKVTIQRDQMSVLDQSIMSTTMDSIKRTNSGEMYGGNTRDKEKEITTLYEIFQEDMENVFNKSFRQDLIERLYRMNTAQKNLLVDKLKDMSMGFKNTEKAMLFIDQAILQCDIQASKVRISSRKQKQQTEYKEKVQAYTKFKIGRKVSSNVSEYTNQEIDEGNLTIKDSSIARILMKWVQALQTQLQQPAKSLYLRDQPFRLNSVQQTYQLSKQQQLQKLYKYYQRSAKVVKQKSQILKSNARQVFLQALRFSQMTKFRSYRTFSSQKDALIGHICTLVEKSKQNHIQSYLGMLINQIKSIEQEYQWLIQDKKVNIASRPSLINLKLGDLMRCQIISKPKEIIALYQYIYVLCKIDTERFQLVRVKDRSDTPNKDILINIFYHKSIMIEIQLAIKNDSAFLNCSDKFSHFIYELQRAFLGAVNQMCSIWSQYSPKAQFFNKKFVQMNIRAVQNYVKDCKSPLNHSYEFEDKQDIGFKLPFWCLNCGVFYSNGVTQRKVCKYCKMTICGVCSTLDNQKYIATYFPEYEKNKECLAGKIYYALDISTNYRHIKTMLKLQINGKIEVFSMKVQQKSPYFQKSPKERFQIKNIKSQYQIAKNRQKFNYKKQLFDQTHIILVKKKPMQQGLQTKLRDKIIKQILQKEYLKRRMKVIIKKSQRFMKLTLITNPKLNQGSKGEIIKKILSQNISKLGEIEKINLNQNGLKEIEIAYKLPRARTVVLNHNFLSQVNLKGLNQLMVLQLAQNNINSFKSLQGLENCKKLRKLILDFNHLRSLQDFPYLINIQYLSLSNNKIQHILKLQRKYSNLKFLNLSQNQLSTLIGINQSENLQQLKLNGNSSLGIQQVLNVKNLKYLKRLDIGDVNLKKTLQQSLNMASLTSSANIGTRPGDEALIALGSLVHLEILNVSHNQLKLVPNFPNLHQLRELNLSGNQLRGLKYLDVFKSLKWLSLKRNKVSNLENLSKLQNLYWLDLSSNPINPPQIGKLKNLHQIGLNNTNLSDLSGLCKQGSINKLYQLNIAHNKIKSLQNLQFPSLDHLDARFNKLTTLKGVQNFKMLRELKLSGNVDLVDFKQLQPIHRLKILHLNCANLTSIQKIPTLKNLQQLYLAYNKISDLAGLQSFLSLKKLQIHNNPIQKYEPIKNLKYLSYLSFSLSSNLDLNVFDKSIDSLESLKIYRKDRNSQLSVEEKKIIVTLGELGYNVQIVQEIQLNEFLNEEKRENDIDSDISDQMILEKMEEDDDDDDDDLSDI